MDSHRVVLSQYCCYKVLRCNSMGAAHMSHCHVSCQDTRCVKLIVHHLTFYILTCVCLAVCLVALGQHIRSVDCHLATTALSSLCCSNTCTTACHCTSTPPYRHPPLPLATLLNMLLQHCLTVMVSAYVMKTCFHFVSGNTPHTDADTPRALP